MVKSQNRRRAKRKERNRRKKRAQQLEARGGVIFESAANVARQADEAYDLACEGDYEESRIILNRLAERYPRDRHVLDTLLWVHQETADHDAICDVASRILAISPRDADALLFHAQSSMICARASVALKSYRKFIQQYPNHEYIEDARTVIAICESESRDRVARAVERGFLDVGFEEGGLEIFAMHEESLAKLQHGQFEDAIALCRQILEQAPNFLSVRNNLATCLFQSGDVEKAQALARETCQLAPDNRFAEATLIRLEFLGGKADNANRLADQLMLDPPTEQDSMAAVMESLSYLGRDEDVIAVSNLIKEVDEMDPDKMAMIYHHHAVAEFRLGNRKAARQRWKECLKMMPTHHMALENLQALNADDGNAGWAESLQKWLPIAFMRKAFEKDVHEGKSDSRTLDRFPAIRALIPALLDRGCPNGREFALGLAEFDMSDEMADVLLDYARSSRGPDEMRFRALSILYADEKCASGPHRFWNSGKWTDVELHCPEIITEPIRPVPEWQEDLARQAIDAMHEEKYDEAEALWQQILDRDPGAYSAEFNLASLWLRRDGQDGEIRAERVIRRLHDEHPDYAHAAIGLAQILAIKGQVKEADALLYPITKRRQLHITEATALHTAQAQIAIQDRNWNAAEIACGMLDELQGSDHPHTVMLRSKIESSKNRRGIFGKLWS